MASTTEGLRDRNGNSPNNLEYISVHNSSLANQDTRKTQGQGLKLQS